jgi:hypothetical protein
MPSQTEICNASLIALGETTIIALVGADVCPTCGRGNNTNITILNAMWDIALGAALRCHPWKFANARAALASALPAPIWGYEHKFTLPVDCVKVISLDESDGAIEYRQVGNFIETDQDAISILYTSRITDCSLFDDLFTQALVYALAANIAPAVKGAGAAAEMWSLFGQILQQARTMDSQAGQSHYSFSSDTFTSVRT